MNQAAASAPAEAIHNLANDERVRRAFAFFTECGEQLIASQIRLNEIPAPPFREQARAQYFKEQFIKLGLTDTTLDEEGNCLALRRGAALHPLLVVSAHLDTVFPSETDCRVRRDDDSILRAPGIADDAAGLVAVLAIAEALNVCALKTNGSLLFVGTVGEEGEGNLRGVRHFFTQGAWAGQVDGFISFDGAGLERITTGALAAKRYRVTWRGAGGHSWGNFGTPNPVHALGRAVAALAAYSAPSNPRTTFNVGRIAGGAGVNVIPTEAVLDVDLRSTDYAELKKLDSFFRRAMLAATDDENAARKNGTPHSASQMLTLDMRLTGDRPGGATPQTTPLVQLCQAATEYCGSAPLLDTSSTDANLPISLGVPALTLGAGGDAGGMHTLEEWFNPAGRERALQRAFLTLLGFVGIS